TLRDPLNVGISDNVIPSSRLSKQALVFLEFMPQPNAQVGTQNFATTPSSALSTQDNYTGRIDHLFSTKDSLSGRYIFNDTFEAGIPFWGHDERNNLGRSQNYVSAWTHTFGPPLLMNCEEDGTGSSRLKSSGLRTIRPSTLWERWDFRWYHA